ncbi:MAG: hypothetical protein COW47_01010 [Candidatus Huberarchaeum crystalense]|uniref:SAM-dependent methyltransferase TRM5/TYW2-type domain-containing protein n=1 Tax=Huberarchaeum crystalense TaxID=2014257 RepID=A0A2G9LJM6_HUBC1|nr:methyltransferase [archaeon]OIP20153.1 MAG: hypothetical protein AUJ91_01980 [archaeon CG2_30_31_98]PIN66725.1 MAG: hypothetical protein COW69_00775 [Candidatus Huberarchaeum crystalense]PIV13759.1 MAG: hypothetical protein COS45_01110 [Candidatus Huberarchaeum crystalense]PIV46503.1 MAG: hypothetical protein COS22_01035 [Candidatus Huberarchaeum crystalense]
MNLKNFVELVISKHPKIPREVIPRAYDVIGDLVVVKLEPETQKYAKEIGESLIELLPRIKSVFYKINKTEGDFRIYPLKLAAGENNTLTLHKENKCLFFVDIAKVFFNSRQGTERLKIANSIQQQEKEILCLFSGVAPFPINIAKKHKAIKITAIELNPNAHKLAQENVKLNKVKDQVKLICGDACQEVKKLLPKSFDLVLMPGPKISEDFLNIVFFAAKKSGRVVFYTFANIGDFETANQKIKSAAEKAKVQIEFLTQRRVLPHSPKEDQICIEFKIV